MKQRIRVVAVDYDGTLTVVDSYPEVGKLNREAVSILVEAKKRGMKIILWTLRTNRYLTEAVSACEAAGLTFDAVNDDLPSAREAWLKANPDCGISRKAAADLYIDDRSPESMLRGGVDWELVRKLLLPEDFA